MSSSSRHALRGAALTFVDDPWQVGAAAALRYESDAVVVIESGFIADFGRASEILATLPPETPLRQVGRDHLILPGFIDAHVHYPQTQIIGAHGAQLLDWLNRYTFVTEQQFASRAHCREVAELFLREALRAGTTTAAVYCTVHPESVEAFFEAATSRGLRMIAGKVLMDRNAPAALCDTVQSGYD